MIKLLIEGLKGKLRKLLFPVLIMAILSLVVTRLTYGIDASALEKVFTVPVFLTLFGFCITMFVFLHNSVISIREKIDSQGQISLEAREKVSSSLESLFSEIAQDLCWMLLSIFFVILIDVVSSVENIFPFEIPIFGLGQHFLREVFCFF